MKAKTMYFLFFLIIIKSVCFSQAKNIGNTKDEIALIEAIRDSNVNEVRNIILKGINLSFFYDDKNTPYYIDSYTPLYYVINKCNSSFWEEPGIYQTFEKDFEILKMLLEAGCDPNVGVKDRVPIPIDYSGSRNSLWYIDGGITPVMMSRILNVTELLLRYGADPNIQDSYGRTALMLHSFFEFYDDEFAKKISTAQFLIENGADINIRDNEGRTALFYAVWGVNEEAIKLLIDHGADVNIRDKKGMTPLIVAHIRYTPAKYKENMINMLTVAGAKISVKDNEKIKVFGEMINRGGWWPEDLYIGAADR